MERMGPEELIPELVGDSKAKVQVEIADWDSGKPIILKVTGVRHEYNGGHLITLEAEED